MKKVLFFLTDRYPYSNSETFIENEISFISETFDEVFVLPTAMCCSTDRKRPIPHNVQVIQPACTDDLFCKSTVSIIDKTLWWLRHMLIWMLFGLCSKSFFSELRELVIKGVSVKKLLQIIKYSSIRYRNKKYFKKQFRTMTFDNLNDYYVYSYWMTSYVCDISVYTGINLFKKIVTRAHGFDLYSERYLSDYIPFQKETMEFVDFVFPISQNGTKYLKEKFPQNTKKIKTFYLGTTDYGVEKNIYENEFIIVSCSAIIPIKRVHLIAKALGQIQVGKKVVWIHFGDGPEMDVTVELAHELIKNENIRFEFRGYISNAELMEFYKHHFVQLFINVSESEGLPVSIMEAMSFGIPVIATNVGGTREAFMGGEHFLLEKQFHISELSSLIEYVISMTTDNYCKMRNETRARWEKLFDCILNYNKFFGFLGVSDDEGAS